MTSRIGKTMPIGIGALALVAFSDPVQAQRTGFGFEPFPWSGLRGLPPCTTVGQTVKLTLNTGTGGVLGTPDPIWTVSSSAGGYGPTAYSTAPGAYWFPNTASAKWIQPGPGGTILKLPLATYVYRTQFTTPVHPYLYASITITGKFSGDDLATMKLNGGMIAYCPSGGTIANACFTLGKTIPGGIGWQSFTQVASGWPFGNVFVNTLTVEVPNTVDLSETGMFAQVTVTAVCSKCTSPIPGCGIAC